VDIPAVDSAVKVPGRGGPAGAGAGVPSNNRDIRMLAAGGTKYSPAFYTWPPQ